MASKTIDSSITREYQLHLIMSEQSQSVANNTTTIAYELRLTSGSYNFSQYGAGWEVWINGTRVAYHDRNASDRYSIAKNSYWTIASGTTTVTHNADGTKTIACSASLDMAGSPAPGALSCPSTNWTLTTIPRASSMSVPTFTIESAGTMTITMATSSFSHSITYSFEGLTGTAATVNAGVTSASWTPPSTFYAKLPSSTSGTVSLVLHTYSGGTEIGTASYTTTVYVGSGIKPTAPSITLYPVNSNAWLNSKGLYVGGYTKLRVVSSATAGSGASMSSYAVSNAFTATGADVTSSSALAAGSRTATVTATDSRGRTNSNSKSVSFLSYSNPTVSLSAERGTYSGGSWTTNASGDHIRVTATPSVSLTANGNAGTVTVKIGSSTPNATSGNYYYFTGTVATSSYTVSASITDSVGNTGTASLSVGVTAVSSTMTYGTLNIGESVTFTISRNNSNFTHTITAALGSQSTTVGTGIGTSTSWTIPSGWLSQVPSATSKTGTLTLSTYRGTALVGSRDYTVTYYVPSSVKPSAPTITLTPVNTNAWISSQGLYVGGYTKLKVQSSATAGSGASMSSYSVTGAFTATGSNVTSSSALTAGSKTVTVTATDSRGRTNSNSSTVTFLAYTNPALTTFDAERGTYAGGSWTSDKTGPHIRVTAVPIVSLSGQGNTGTVTVKIGATNPDATSGNYYYFTSTNETTSYSVTGTITDSVGNASTRALTVPTIEVPVNINVDLPGVGFGMIAQNALKVVIAPNWSLGVNGKNNTFAYMPYSFNTSYSSGNTGYLRIAQITVTGTYPTSGICFAVQRLIDMKPIMLYVRFANENTTDPSTCELKFDDLNGTYVTSPFVAFAYKEATSVWGIYVYKVSATDSISVTTYVTPYMQARCNITYSEARLASVPSGVQTALPINEWNYIHSASPGNITLINCTGTVATSYFRMWEKNNRLEYSLEARWRIADFSRTGAMPGISFPTNARPQAAMYGYFGMRSDGNSSKTVIPESLLLTLATDGTMTVRGMETYWNCVTGGYIYFMIPRTNFAFDY